MSVGCRATQDGQVVLKCSDRRGFTGVRNESPHWYSCLENPMDSMKRQKDMSLEDEPSRSEGIQYATGKERRGIMDSS